MTDGIIQEVIEKWFMSNLFPNGVLTHELTYTDILILQGKLIENIKQKKIEISDFTWSGYSDGVNSLVEELIGDNQE